MDTQIKIMQGFAQIGGNIILIEGEKSRLVFDFGIPLTESDGTAKDIKIEDKELKECLPDIPALYQSTQDKETIVFISHAHPDHFGLIRYIDKSIPIYATKITKELINKCSSLLYNSLFEDLNIKETENTIQTYDFIIEAYEVNHSVEGACAFQITEIKSGKTILYTGDLRTHGRNNKRLADFIQNNKKCDYLITEGTTLSRETNTVKTENDIENELTEIFKLDKMSIISCSPLNTDRFVSVYNACIKAGKTLVIDPYTAYILESFKGTGMPDYKSDGIKVYCAKNKHSMKIFENPRNKRFGRNKISFEEIKKNPEKYVIKDNARIHSIIRKTMNIDNINLVYSYWEGYLDSENYRWSGYKDRLKLVHTSGHIYKNQLTEFIKQLSPKNIIPVHTLANNKFKELFENVILSRNINIA